MIEFNPGLTIWSLIAFFVLLIVLSKTAWPQILKALNDREESIRNSLDEAEKAREAAEGAKQAYAEMMAKAKKETAQLIKQGQENAEKIREELMLKAKDEANAMVEKAKREIDVEREKALAEMKERAVNLSVAISAKIITASLDENQQKELALQAIKEMEA